YRKVRLDHLLSKESLTGRRFFAGRAHQWTRGTGCCPFLVSRGGWCGVSGVVGRRLSIIPSGILCGCWGVRCWVSEGATCVVGSCVPPLVNSYWSGLLACVLVVGLVSGGGGLVGFLICE